MTPLITVAIPTRNRQLCAATLVRAALELIPDCQVVVNDNSDDDSLGALLGDMVSDPRLSYCYQPDNLSVVENFNNALARSTGEYITFLGDDDMIGPRFREFVLKAKAAGIDALLYRTDRRPLHYFWPGVSSPRWGDMGGKLYFSRYTGRGHDLDIQWASRDAIAHLGTGPRRMPRIYLGVISRKLVERAEATFGPLFGGFSPDVYSSHLLARCCAKPVVVDYPLIIPGASPKSTSAARAERSDGAMTIRTTKSRVTFNRPFSLKGVDGVQPPGSYEVETDEEVIEGNERTVYRRVATILYLSAGGTTVSCTIDPDDLAAVLARDAADG